MKSHIPLKIKSKEVATMIYTHDNICLKIEIKDEVIVGIDFCSEGDCVASPIGTALESDIHLQFGEYFEGRREDFALPYLLQGTHFQLSVWQALEEIPYAQTVSYSSIAQQIGNPKAVRAVGGAVGSNPLPLIIPCHRVIGKNGAIVGFRGGTDIKQALLNLEQKGQAHS
ncbi:MAG: methylated-DNA--[protein]-cysteine S-methyltransferase [Candidatus Cloacimonadaceae bacterium]|nr:methylated-DNA--[protein]-cysteine S-methyltransferase [Candidatus Cloacimonadaceae bacterium]